MGTRYDRMTEEEFIDKKTQMNDVMVGMQLDAVVKLLNGKLQHFACVDSSGKKYKNG
jgi:putative sterol carrier protein